MPRMLYHDDPDWYERPGETVDIPLGPALTRSKSYVVPALPWQRDHDSEIVAVIPFGEPGQTTITIPSRSTVAVADIAQAVVDPPSIDPEPLPRDQPATDLTGSH